MQRPAKRYIPAIPMQVNMLFESAVMSHLHPRGIYRTDESDNSVNPAMRADRSLVLCIPIAPLGNRIREELGKAVVAGRDFASE